MNKELVRSTVVRYFYVSLNTDIPEVHPKGDLLNFLGYYRAINQPHTIAYFLRKYVPIGTRVDEVTKEEYDLTHPGWDELNDEKTN